MGEAPSSTSEGPLSAEELRKIDAYWRATLYLCVGMIYLRDNPLLREPLKIEHIKNRLLGHWGTDPGQSFTWVHLNRFIEARPQHGIRLRSRPRRTGYPFERLPRGHLF